MNSQSSFNNNNKTTRLFHFFLRLSLAEESYDSIGVGCLVLVTVILPSLYLPCEQMSRLSGYLNICHIKAKFCLTLV